MKSPSNVRMEARENITDPERASGPTQASTNNPFYKAILKTPLRGGGVLTKLAQERLPPSASSSATATSATHSVTTTTASEVSSHQSILKNQQTSRTGTTQQVSTSELGQTSEMLTRKSVSITTPVGGTKLQQGLDKKRVSSDQSRSRAKSFVLLGRMPVAAVSQSESTNPAAGPLQQPTSTTTSARASVATLKQAAGGTEKIEEPASAENDTTTNLLPKKSKRLRTLRIWKPNQGRRGIALKIGEEEEEEDADKIFEASQIRNKSYGQWKKKATARLPSISGGGTPIPEKKVAEVIGNAPALKKEEDPRTLQKAIKRLSLELEGKEKGVSPETTKKEPVVKVDYRKVREIHWKEDETKGKSKSLLPATTKTAPPSETSTETTTPKLQETPPSSTPKATPTPSTLKETPPLVLSKATPPPSTSKVPSPPITPKAIPPPPVTSKATPPPPITPKAIPPPLITSKATPPPPITPKAIPPPPITPKAIPPPPIKPTANPPPLKSKAKTPPPITRKANPPKSKVLPPAPRKQIAPRPTPTPPKPVPLSKLEKDDSSDDDDTDDSSDDTEPDEPSDDDYGISVAVSGDEEERQLEEQRKKAGIDIKDKVKALREMVDNLSNKRAVRQKLIENATGFLLLDTEQIPVKEQILYIIEAAGYYFHDLVDRCVIWKKHIREINGRFGVVIASYFIWLRLMVALELFAFIVTNAIVIIPQVVEDLKEGYYFWEQEGTTAFSISDLLNGEGSFHHSYLYYTGYRNRNERSDNPFENPAFRFIFCILFMFLVLTYFIFSRLTKYYQSVRLESKVVNIARMEHFKSIICGWDYSCRDPQAKIYLHKTIRRELFILARVAERHTGSSILLLEMEHKKILRFAVKHLGMFWGPWAIHIVGNLFIVIACVILAVILVELCQLKLLYYIECVSMRDDQHFYKVLHHDILCPSGSQYLSTWILSLPALFASMTTLLLTRLILFVADNEVWNSPERKIYATMIRAGLFYLTNVGVFYTFWITRKPLLNKHGYVAETIFGKELYRLVVIQGVMDVGLNFGLKLLYHKLRERSKSYVKTEFRTEYSSLGMFFLHSVSRIGTLFCPPLSIFVTFRFILDYYQNRYALLYLSAQDSYSAHASQVYGPFLLTFFILCYLITSFMNVYYVTETIPSDYNGPFLLYNDSYGQVLGMLVGGEQRTNWLTFMVQPGFLLTFNAVLGALVYFCYYWSRTYVPIIEHLNELITAERADRNLLLKAIFEIGQVTDDMVKTPTGGRKSKILMREAIKNIFASSGVLHEKGPSQPVTRKPSAEARDIARLEKTVDKQIGEFIHQMKRRSKNIPPNLLLSSLPKKPLPVVSLYKQQPKKNIQDGSSKPAAVVSEGVRPDKVPDSTDIVSKEKSKATSDQTNKKAEGYTGPNLVYEWAKKDAKKGKQDPKENPNLAKELANKQKIQKVIDDKANQKRTDHLNSILGQVVANRRKLMTRKSIVASQLPPSQTSQHPAADSKLKAKPPDLKKQLDKITVTSAKHTKSGRPITPAKGNASHRSVK